MEVGSVMSQKCSICGEELKKPGFGMRFHCSCGSHDEVNCDVCNKRFVMNEPVLVASAEDDNPNFCSKECEKQYIQNHGDMN